MIPRPVFSGLLFSAVLFLATAQALSREASENPLIGRWLVERVRGRDATKLPSLAEWEFTKQEIVVRGIIHSGEISRNKYTIDTSKEPMWITVTLIYQGTQVREGIFRIVGDELHIKQNLGEGGRPMQFPKDDYLVLKRRSK
jgi:uncharacterized protein (TIGR03067 family)